MKGTLPPNAAGAAQPAVRQATNSSEQDQLADLFGAVHEVVEAGHPLRRLLTQMRNRTDPDSR